MSFEIQGAGQAVGECATGAGKQARFGASSIGSTGFFFANDELARRTQGSSSQLGRYERIASAKQQVAERSLELVNQGMQLLEQEKDEWKRRVGEMQPEPLETQRYEAASAPRAAGQPARDEGVPSPDLGEVKDVLDEKGTALVPVKTYEEGSGDGPVWKLLQVLYYCMWHCEQTHGGANPKQTDKSAVHWHHQLADAVVLTDEDKRWRDQKILKFHKATAKVAVKKES